MRYLFIAAIFVLGGSAHAAGLGCQNTAGGLILEKIQAGATGSQPFGCINRSFDTIAATAASTASIAALSLSTAAIQADLNASKIIIAQSTTNAISPARIDLSTVAAALALKIDKVNGTASGLLSVAGGVAASSAAFGSGGNASIFSTVGGLAMASGASLVLNSSTVTVNNDASGLANTAIGGGLSAYAVGGTSAVSIRARGSSGILGISGLSYTGQIVGAGNALEIYTNTDSPLIFGTTYAERMRITGNGRFGLFVSTPAFPVHVSSSGTFYVDGSNLKLELRTSSIGGAPATSGTSNPNTRLRINSADTNYLDFGNYATGTGGGWIQSGDRSDQSVKRPLSLNPNGGAVGIGIDVPSATSTVHIVTPGFGLGVSIVGNLQVSDDSIFKTGYFSQSLTSSSATILGAGLAIKGGQGFTPNPSGFGSIYGLNGNGLTLQGEAGSANQLSLLESGGNGYWLIGRNPHLYLVPGYASSGVGIGLAAGAAVAQKLEVNGNIQADNGIIASTATISDNLSIAGAPPVAGYGLASYKSLLLYGTANELRFGGAQDALIGHTGAFRTTFQTNGLVRQIIDVDGGVSMPYGLTASSGTFNTGRNIIGNYWSALSAQTGTKGVSLGWDSSQNMGIIAPWSTAGLAWWTYNGASWGERMRLDISGNLGIGTASPASALSVGGTGTVLGSIAQPIIVAVGTGDKSIAIQGGTGGAVETVIRSVLLRGQFGTTTNHKVAVIQNGAEVISVDESGSYNASFAAGVTMASATLKGFWEPYSRTRAQIDTLAPTKVGQVIYASDTTLPGLCISTGTAAAQWRKMESATLGCGTGN